MNLMPNSYRDPPVPAELWLVEDNAAFRSNLAEMLNAIDHIDCSRDFPSCEEATEALRQCEEKPQAILVDISFPGMSGIEGLQHIQGIAPDIRCIVLTSSDKQQDIFNAISAGAAGYWLKHSSIDQLVRGIQDVMAGGASLDPQVTSIVLNAFPKSHTNPREHELTDREIEVLKHLADGLIIKEISDLLQLSPHTVKFHVANTYKKLNVQSQAGAVAKGIRMGII
ncbi:response regulator transcription factor [Verrucomicrobiaceae bacterium R5-34]|nr:response regulator transcription factor [Verrucomicrobiaceae bacterium R5-34]